MSSGNEFQPQVELNVQGIDAPAAPATVEAEPTGLPLAAPAGEVVQTTPETEGSKGFSIPVGKILLWVLGIDAAWTLLTSITPTIVVWQAAAVTHTNVFLAILATGSTWLTWVIAHFLFNLFFAFCFAFVFGGGAFVVTVAIATIFGGKK